MIVLLFLAICAAALWLTYRWLVFGGQYATNPPALTVKGVLVAVLAVASVAGIWQGLPR